MLLANHLTYCLTPNSLPLIDGINLSFSPGKVYGILGPNGAGKSTFLKCLAGIWTPTAGSTCWKGVALNKCPRIEIAKILTLVPQGPQIAFEYTVEEFVAMGCYPHGKLEKIELCMQKVNILHLRNRPIQHISQGERQRTYVARALATEACIMLLDEPAANLDIKHRLEMWELMKTLAEEGKTIIVANHDLVNSERYCEHVAVLNFGKSVCSGPFEETFTPSLRREVFGI